MQNRMERLISWQACERRNADSDKNTAESEKVHKKCSESDKNTGFDVCAEKNNTDSDKNTLA